MSIKFKTKFNFIFAFQCHGNVQRFLSTMNRSNISLDLNDLFKDDSFKVLSQRFVIKKLVVFWVIDKYDVLRVLNTAYYIDQKSLQIFKCLV